MIQATALGEEAVAFRRHCYIRPYCEIFRKSKIKRFIDETSMKSKKEGLPVTLSVILSTDISHYEMSKVSLAQV